MRFSTLIKAWACAGVAMAAFSVCAQTQSPVRLALVSVDPKAQVASDLLTAELSQAAGVILLERDQVARVYQELTITGTDLLKLGQVLGADGLLFLDSAEEKDSKASAVTRGTELLAANRASEFRALNVRLVAVKPGVVLTAERLNIEGDKIAEWANAYAPRLQLLLPKLAVLTKEAIPISVVNFRSAISVAEAPELERQLQTLAIQRLSREPQLFVLERQKLRPLGDEKSLWPDETAFWNGAWLLEAVVDQEGYSRDHVTLNGKLTPANSAAPRHFQVSGSRSNLAEVIHELATRVVEALQISSRMADWRPADEAEKFYAEAKWALRWRALDQAQTAADAAWALGRRSLDCAVIRVRSRTAQIPLVLPPGSGVFQFGRRANFVTITEPPEERFLEIALQALNSYAEFCRVSPEGEPKILTRGPGWNDWRNSEWYQIGIETLEAVARVLQHFHSHPTTAQSSADQLAELRASARAVAELIVNAPSVRDSYFVGNRIANHDELAHTMGSSRNIFSCLVNWGCFWQERPEDTVQLYRRLLASAVFCYIHEGFWKRDEFRPRLVAWNDRDRQRIPQVWEAFLQELNTSTNLLWRMEAKALVALEAKDKPQAEQARQEWWSLVRSNRAELVANNVELFYLGWRFEANAETEAMNQEYWTKTIPALKAAAAFEAQKTFLREHQPYDFRKFTELFREKTYSQPQAEELLPLIIAYRSNLMAEAQTADRTQKTRLESHARSIEVSLQRIVERRAKPQAQTVPQRLASPAPTAEPSPARPARRLEPQTGFTDAITNIIPVRKFLEIPLDGLSKETITSIRVTAHRLIADQLILDLQFGRAISSFDAAEKWRSTRYAAISAVAILHLATENWQVIEGEETDSVQSNPFYYRTVLWRGSIFTSHNGSVQKYDAGRQTWVTLNLPDVGHCGLYVINDGLYGVTREMIFEFLEGGTRIRVLASNRRQPPTSTLDSETLSNTGMVLGMPALFGPPGGELHVITPTKFFSWNGTDWREVFAQSQPLGRPQLDNHGVLIVGNGWQTAAGIWRWPLGGNQLEYCLGTEQSARPRADQSSLQPTWKTPPGLFMATIAAASRGNDLLVLRDHSTTQNIVNEREKVIIGKKILTPEGFHASVLYFSSNYSLPQQLFLKFDDHGGMLPVMGAKANAAMLTGAPKTFLCAGRNQLYLGCEVSFGPVTSSSRTGELPRIGVWALPLEQVDREIERQRKVQVAWQEGAAATSRQKAHRLLDEFDRNRDGRLDSTELDLAFRKESFIASQLEHIDRNSNGWLDATELKFFDANTNEVLDANEQIGLEHAQRLLATQLVNKFDSDGNGLLDRREFQSLSSAHLGTMGMSIPFPDTNHDNWIDEAEAQTICQLVTSRDLQRFQPTPAFMPPGMLGTRSQLRDDHRFKAQVDNFWQNHGTNAVRQPNRSRSVRPGGPKSDLPK